MAPSAVETLPVRAAPASKAKHDASWNKEGLIGYGEAYVHEKEIKGTETQAPASFPNYLPVWDNETERYVSNFPGDMKYNVVNRSHRLTTPPQIPSS